MNTKIKVCSKCGTEKNLREFYARKARKNGQGVMSWCKECFDEYVKQDRKNNPQRHFEIKRRFRLRHPERLRADTRKWAANNPVKYREICKRSRIKTLSTSTGRLDWRMGCAIRKALRANKAGRTWESLVGYSVLDLQVHLQSKFTPGMTWERFLKGEIHIDHIIPKSRFHYETSNDPEFKVCWGLANLQPLWARENLLKGAKLPEQNQ